jgi:hypothetical protein
MLISINNLTIAQNKATAATAKMQKNNLLLNCRMIIFRDMILQGE